MTMPRIPVALGLALVLSGGVILGCSKGEDVPLVSPGVGRAWPADPGWYTLPEMFSEVRPADGVWDETTGRIVLVGSRGAVLEHVDGVWNRKPTGISASLQAVARLAPDEYVAVGLGGGVCYGREGSWRCEDAGTAEDLTVVLTVEQTAWAVGGRGTVVRRDAGQWIRLPAAGPADLVGVALLNDSLFVAQADTSTIRVWDGETWSSLAPPPWSLQHNLGLIAGSDGRLYAAADSLYVREPDGWHTATDSRFFSLFGDPFRIKLVGQSLWYGTYSWSRIDLTSGTRQPHVAVPHSYGIVAPRDTSTYLTANYVAEITWVEDGQARRDPAGNLGVDEAIPVDAGELLVFTELGVYERDATSRTRVLAPEQVPELYVTGFRAGCGRSREDYYLAGNRILYHCVDGQAVVRASWPEYHYINSLGVDVSGEIYMGGSEGLWHLQGAAWERVRPLAPDDDAGYQVWSLGNGDLGARNGHDEYFWLRDGSWLALGRLSWRAVLLADADGTIFAIGEMSGTEDFSGGNVLLVYDERAGAFRNLWDRGMGPLVDLTIEGARSSGGEVLVWTRDPTMVFTLDGSPLQADWRLVAGPLDADLQYLTPLPDGSLLGLDSDDRQFHLYRP